MAHSLYSAKMASNLEEKIDKVMSLVNSLNGKFEDLNGDIKSIRDDITGVKSDIADMKESINSMEEKVDRKLEDLKQEVYKQLDVKIGESKTGIQEAILGEAQEYVNELLGDMKLPDLIVQHYELKDTVEELKRKLDKPFDPDRSVVVYGLADSKDESLDQTVSWLLSTVLSLSITPKFYERTTPKNDKPGVIKIEFKTAFDKVLRAKKKCEAVARTKNVKITSCDSHDTRVAKINTRFILSKIPEAKNYIVSGNGVIREKQPQREEGDEDDNGDTNGDTPPSDHVAAGTIIDNSALKSVEKPPEKTRDESGTPRPPPKGNEKPKGKGNTPKPGESNSKDPKKPKDNSDGVQTRNRQNKN